MPYHSFTSLFCLPCIVCVDVFHLSTSKIPSTLTTELHSDFLIISILDVVYNHHARCSAVFCGSSIWVLPVYVKGLLTFTHADKLWHINLWAAVLESFYQSVWKCASWSDAHKVVEFDGFTLWDPISYVIRVLLMDGECPSSLKARFRPLLHEWGVSSKSDPTSRGPMDGIRIIRSSILEQNHWF
jgi:hypothetical protein